MHKLDEFFTRLDTPNEIRELFLKLATKEIFKKNSIVSKSGEATHHFYI